MITKIATYVPDYTITKLNVYIVRIKIQYIDTYCYHCWFITFIEI